MKQTKARGSRSPLLLIVGAMAPFLVVLGLIAYDELVGLPFSWSMPLGTFAWSLVAATAVITAMIAFRSITKEKGGSKGRAVLPTAMQSLALLSLAAVLMLGDQFAITSGSYLALALVGLMPALVVFNCWMYRRERRSGRLSAARAFLTATEYMSLGVLFIVWSYLSTAVSWPVAVDVLFIGLAAAVLFGDIWRTKEDASGLGRFLYKFIKTPQRR